MRAGIAVLPELSIRRPTREVLAGAGRDLFFAAWNCGTKVGGKVTPETLAPPGIQTYELTESCIHAGPKARSGMQDMYNDIPNLGRIFGVADRAEELIAGWQARLAEVTAGVDHAAPMRVVVHASGEGAPCNASACAMPTAPIEPAGGVNIMADLDKSWAEIGREPVAGRDPEAVVAVNGGDVAAAQKIACRKENPALAGIDAVKNDSFVVLAGPVGAGLGLVGAALQAVTRNPLADPHLMGIPSGEAPGAIAALMHTGLFLGLQTVPLMAFAGALAATVPVPCGSWLGARAGRLNAMSLGDETAASLGIEVGRFRLCVFVVCALITGVMVAFSGLIGFAGLVMPHLVRLVTGGDAARVLPGSAVAGAVFPIWTDVAARVGMAPEDVLIGVVTGPIGTGPIGGVFFIGTLARCR